MNIHDYRNEIEILRKAASDLNDIAIKIQDSQNGMDNHGDLIAAESDVCHLMLAARLVFDTIPRDPVEQESVKLLRERNEVRRALDACLNALLSGGDTVRRMATEQAKTALANTRS